MAVGSMVTKLKHAGRPPREVAEAVALRLRDAAGIATVEVAASILTRVPLIGSHLSQLVLAGETLGGATLSRFFALHVVLLPLALIGLVFVHIVALHHVWRLAAACGLWQDEAFLDRLLERQALPAVGGPELFETGDLWQRLQPVSRRTQSRFGRSHRSAIAISIPRREA